MAGKNERSALAVRRRRRGAASDKHALPFGAPPRSERTEKALSVPGFIVRWAARPRARSGMVGTTWYDFSDPARIDEWQVVANT